MSVTSNQGVFLRLLLVLQEFFAALWIGGMWVVGYLVVPLLFRFLPDRQQAGLLAGHMLEAVALMSLIISPMLLLMAYWSKRLAKLDAMLIITIGGLSLIGLVFVNPILVELKVSVAPQYVLDSQNADKFRMWHAISSSLYLSQSLLGLLFFWRKANYR